jgi:hypothetical protein
MINILNLKISVQKVRLIEQILIKGYFNKGQLLMEQAENKKN